MIVNKTTVRAAVEQLSKDTRFVTRVKDIRRLVENWTVQPLVFAGDLILYNVLIEIGLADRTKLERIFILAEQARPATPLTTKANYQREYMRKRRQRLIKAQRLHESRTGQRLTKDESAAFRTKTHRNWAAARDKVLLGAGDLSWDEKNEKTNEFWDSIDDALNRALEEV